jgi:hypothetical protein
MIAEQFHDQRSATGADADRDRHRLSWLKRRWDWLDRVMDDRPLVIVQDGKRSRTV